MSHVRIVFMLLALAAPTAGCFSIDAKDGAVQCNTSVAVQCPQGYFCSDGLCYRDGHTPPARDMATPEAPGDKQPGAACSGANQCESGFCIDGVCCNSECADSCNACNVPGKEGTCSPVPAGQTPATGHADCGPDATSSCGRDGTCDGAGQCKKYDADTVCKPSSCDLASNLFVADSTCDGKGNCIAPASITCAPFTCKGDKTACYPTCTAGGPECSSGNVCTNGSCGLKVDASVCAKDDECQSGKCIDKVCCHTACDGQCQACDITASRGKCTTVASGQPHFSHTACITSVPKCAGSCTGNPSACTYPDTSTVCVDQSCSSAVVTYANKCDGGGKCVAPNPPTLTCQVPSNGNATCNGSHCGVSCNAYYAPDPTGTQCVPVWTQEGQTTFAGIPLRGIWGSSAGDIYVISSKQLFHSTGNGQWTKLYSVDPSSIWSFGAIWGGGSPLELWIAGEYAIFHSTDNGATWTNLWKGSSFESLNGIAGDGNASPGVLAAGRSSKVWFCLIGLGGCNEYSQTAAANFSSVTWNAGGGFLAGATDGKIYQSGDNALFSSIFSTGWSAVLGIWGSTEFLAVGKGGGIAHGDSQNNWKLQTSGTTQDLSGVYGISSADGSVKNYYAVGGNGTILFSSGGGNWSPQASNTTALLNAVWASGLNDVYAVGSDGAGNGVIMHLK